MSSSVCEANTLDLQHQKEDRNLRFAASKRRQKNRGSGSIEPKGLAVNRVVAFPQGWQSCDVDSSEPLRLRHLPYPRYRAAEEDIATYTPSTSHSSIVASVTNVSTLMFKL